MNIPARWWAAGIAVVLAATLAASAAEPVIDLSQSAAEGAIQDSQRQQIDKYVAFQIDKMAKATSQDQVVAARGRLTESYNRFGTKAQEFMLAFADSLAGHGKAMLAGLAADDPLRGLKEVNLSLTASRMGQVTLGPLTDVMVSHADPAVRYFGWIAYAAMRGPVVATGGKAAQSMYAVLSARLQKETDPHVLAEMLKMFTFHDIGEAGGGITPAAYADGLARLFKILDANWLGLCRRVMPADGNVAEAASTAVEAVSRIKDELKEKIADPVAIQLVANMTWSAGKAFDLALGIQEAAEAARLADKAAKEGVEPPRPADKAGKKAAESPIEDNVTAAKDLADKAQQLAQKIGKDANTLGSQAPQSEYAVSAVTKLLLDCEASLNAQTQRNETYISKALGATGSDRAAGVRLGVLKWIDDLVAKYNIKRPEDVVPAKAAPAVK
jgi:hypothetical protein